VPDDRVAVGDDAVNRQLAVLVVLLELLREARQARTVEALRFVFVNRLRRLINYRQAVFLTLGPAGRARVGAVSNVALPEKDAPFVRWLEAAARSVAQTPEGRKPHLVTAADVPPHLRTDFTEWGPPQALWVPLPGFDEAVPAALWLTRDGDWNDGELVLIDQIAEGFGSAWWALARPRRKRGVRLRRWLTTLAVMAAIGGVLALPVPRSTLAPAEVSARDPLIVAAPLEGAIDRFMVQPNAPVTAGQPLFSFEPTVLRSRSEVARKALTAAEAEHLTAAQGAFGDQQAKARLAQLKAQVELKRAELAFALDLLDRVTVKAERSGIAVFTDANDWLGKPVSVGERIMTLADPDQTEIEIHVAVADALDLEEGAAVRLFLNVDPLHPINAKVRHASYEPGMTATGVLAYRVLATLDPDGPKPRIGLRGTAKIEGETVPLALHLFRRPLAAARQTLGL
jgi:multidrug resistance efflux pump